MSVDTQTRTQQTEVDIPNPDLTLVPGMYVNVRFELQQHGLLSVPAAAMLFRESGPQVAVVDAACKVSFHPVVIARDDGDTVELAGGVRPGDRVALNISGAIVPGQEVTAIQDATPTPQPSPHAGPSGFGRTVEPTPPPTNHAPINRPAGGTGNAANE